MSAREAVLRIDGLRVRLPAGADRRYAIEDVHLEVPAAGILCVVGESGSGKSVTALTVMGLLPPGHLVVEAGTIAFEGEQLLAASRARMRTLRGRRMSMIFQEPMTALNPVPSGGRSDRGGAARAHHLVEKRAPGARAGDSCGCPSPASLGDCAGLSPSAFRRSAPAHHDRYGAGVGATAVDRR